MVMINQDFGRLEQFDGHNFHRWQQNIQFLLATLGVVHVLTEDPPVRYTDDCEDQINNYNFWH